MFENLLGNRRPSNHDEDFFRDTRMSFGDHLDELRTRMWRAIKGLALATGGVDRQAWIGTEVGRNSGWLLGNRGARPAACGTAPWPAFAVYANGAA